MANQTGAAHAKSHSQSSHPASHTPDKKAKRTTDHDEIRKWAEERGAHPARVKTKQEPEGSGILRLDFPRYSGGDSLQPIEWDEFFEEFDAKGLALLFQEETAAGEESNFHKFVRVTAEEE